MVGPVKGSAAVLGALVLLGSCKAPRSGPMVPIDGAAFEMGCDPARDPGCGPDEQPRHRVVVRQFSIDRTEVTQAEYLRCVEAGACARPSAGFEPALHPRRPVTGVTWNEAREFCRWRGARLPSEAEWELAARGTGGRIYPWGDDPPTCDRAHTRACGEGPAEAGTRAAGASPEGVLDLAGNADEWVEDSYRSYGGAHTATSGQRVARGGAWDAWHSRSTARNAIHPGHRDPLLGFRCAASR